MSTALIACGLLVGLKAAEMRQFTAGTMTMSSVCALIMTVTVGFGIEMTKGWFMIILLLALSISVFTADKVAAKHSQKMAGIAAGSQLGFVMHAVMTELFEKHAYKIAMVQINILIMWLCIVFQMSYEGFDEPVNRKEKTILISSVLATMISCSFFAYVHKNI